MRKYLILLVGLLVVATCLTAVSAEDIDTTQELTDSTTISQESNIATDDIDSPTIEKNTQTKSETKSEPVGDDCCSAIIQGYNNNSAISFRRDSISAVTINVTHNSSYVKQCKGSGNYFFHVLVSKDGWIVGHGGLDDTKNNHEIENYALSMMSNQVMNNTTFNSICNLKKNTSKGHFVIKAPNGNYALYITYYGNTKKETGTLLPGQYLVVPNDSTYFQKGYFQDVISTTNISTASRIIAAKDKYNDNRRDIITYYIKKYPTYTQVKVYACNDDGSYANKSSGKLVDSIQTNSKFFPASSIPTVPNSVVIDDITLISKKTNTTITSKNFTTNNQLVNLTASIKDEYGNPINYGFVSLLINDKTLKYPNGTDAYFNVKNGSVLVKLKISDLWKRKNYTYQFRYYGKSNYESNLGNKAVITLANIVNLTSTHAKTTIFGSNLTITAKVKYKLNNSNVDSGKVLFKVNGKTIRNDDGSTYLVDVKNGTAKYNLILDYKYSPKEYNITVVYANGACREESNTIVKINKIPAKVISPSVTVKNKVVSVKAKFVDTNNKVIVYDSYMSAKINGKTIRDSNNNTMIFNFTGGVINFNFTLTANYKKGNHTFTFVIPELRAHLSVRQNVTMTI
ncbi:MAG: hypothetical protein E7Z85_05175 [Methanosphaera stadtmanae]|nr:hypothetical protein [Methanosphaera stadtmanae]